MKSPLLITRRTKTKTLLMLMMIILTAAATELTFPLGYFINENTIDQF